MSSNLIKEILKELQSSKSLQLSGLTLAAQAYVIEQVKRSFEGPLLIVCSDTEQAAKLYQDFKFFNQNEEGSALKQVDYFSGWEQSPYLSLTPSVKSRLRRLRSIDRLLRNELDVLICDVASIAQRSCSKRLFFERAFNIETKDLFERDELIERLLNAGYSMTDLTEDPGQFSVRGSIIDIYGINDRYPSRIDFFDIEVEAIRHYDPNTQKSFSHTVQKIHIAPVQPFTLTNDSIGSAKAKLKEFCDAHGVLKKTRDTWVEQLAPHRYLPELEYYSYLFEEFSDEDSSLLTHFSKNNWTVIVSDLLSCEQAVDDFYSKNKSDYAAALEALKIAPDPQFIFEPLERLSSFITKDSKLQFNSLQLKNVEDVVAKDAPEDVSDESTGALNLRKHPQIHLYTNEEFSNAKTGFDQFTEKAALWKKNNYLQVVSTTTSSQAERVRFLLEQKSISSTIVSKINPTITNTIQILEGQLSAGFRLPSCDLVFLTDSELFGQKKLRSSSAKAKKDSSMFSELGTFVSSLDDLNPGDFVVHYTHGIGRYLGLTKLEVDKIPQDFLLLEYLNNDKLYLPVYRLDLIQKYIGSESSSAVTLDKLGSGLFEKTKIKVKQELQDVAHKLLDLYAKRASREGLSYSPPGEDYQKFEAQFPFAETQDQLKAIEDIEKDMGSSKIMDRLVCGDVGYGKTEVAMRAAYRCVLDSHQVAILVPTTVLALQHERSFIERFKNTPVRVDSLSRLKSSKEIKKTLEDLKAGAVDIVIGTHRLLSKDIQFKNLGLLVVDEEQRFGVEAKEKIKTLKVSADVLTLTATPIPRTLQLSMMGLRDISIINTPPVDRLAIRTYISKFDEETIRRAIKNELSRGGQVFFIHNRVQSIHAMADRLKSIVPEARILIGHGQMDEKALEEVMLSFYDKKADILLSSTIIESGLDIPSANTIIINRADTFGLAQLYQLRGRVGRSQLRAYCYLLLPEGQAITEDSKKRLEVIQRYVELGSGFKIASHDLELRGGGDILGKSQSGHITAIGYEMFMELLDEAIRGIKGEHIEEKQDPEIKLPTATRIPEEYIQDIHQRLHFYKRLSEAHEADQITSIEIELQDRYGKLPSDVQNLIWLIHIKNLLRTYSITSLVVGKEKASLEATKDSKLNLNKVLDLVRISPNLYAITPDSKLILKSRFDSAQKTFHALEQFLSKVAEPKGAC